jgi:hypothetical protein
MRPTVANADDIYVDPSALRCLYVHDHRSRAFCAWRARLGGSISITSHGRAELGNSIMLAVFRKDIDRNSGDAALNDVDDDLATGRLRLVDIPWRRTLQRTAHLSQVHTPKLGTRTLDVLHVASALELECRILVTYDARQAMLAKAVGLRTTKP